ncbi:MAG: DNA internalization-related competence protein ComEC/Rec2 [Deltaproteobacteria bacterium]|nr:DNA internalization-related competence protein ComEC/Rec2 [Deltaproteobacteria bacterium]
MDRQSHPFPLFGNSQPLIPVTLFFILGIVAASYQWLNHKTCFSILIITMLILTLGIIKKWRLNLLLICIVFFLLGAILSGQQINPPFPPNHIKIIAEQYNSGEKDDPGISIEGVLSEAPERFPDKTRLSIDTERIFTPPSPIKDFGDKVTGKILITVGSPSVKVNYGDRIRFVAKLRIPKNFGNPGEFDYAGSLARQDIYVTAYVENERWIAVLGDKERTDWRTAIEHIRDNIRKFIDDSGIEYGAIIKALIIGEQGEIPKNIRDKFSATGTTHILAISGLNIGIIAFVAYWTTFQLLRQSERLMLSVNIRKLAAASSIIPVLVYGAVAGLSVSTQRAVLMVIIFIIAVLADKEKTFYNTLAAAAFVILIISPLAIYDISFQLSFISVLAIIYLVPKFQALWKGSGETNIVANTAQGLQFTVQCIKNYLLNPLAVSIAASIGTAPFIAYHFHRVSLIGLLANLIVVPLMGFMAVLLGLIAAFMSFFNQSIAYLFLKLTDVILKVSIWIVDLFARLPHASVFTTTPTIIEAVLFYLLIICIVEFKRVKTFKYILPIVIFAILGNYSYWYYHLNYNSNLKVTFISVGQGDSTLVEFPYGKRMLIDGGGFYNENFDVGERIVAPFLWKNKINRIDYLLLSHPQSDHMKGLKFIAEKFHAKEFRWNGMVRNDKTFTELFQSLDKNNTTEFITNASAAPLDINGVRVNFLNPPEESNFDTNNNSLVVRLDYKDASFLFTGDIEAVGEASVIKNATAGVTVLKVPHHGSRTSSTIDFLNKVKPALAVVSVGYMNPFGFPHPEILKRYNEFKIPLLRTDILGAITVETDGQKKRVSSYR